MKNTIILWSARILGILAILFMLLFSLDCFEEYTSLSDKLICFTMHNWVLIFPLAALVIAWKFELAGGIIYLLVFIAASIFYKTFSGNLASLVVIAPFCIIGCLFILHYFAVKKKS